MKRIYIIMMILIPTISFSATETMKWYIDGSVYATTTCESGNNITMPTTPTRRGYTFNGWMPSVFDTRTLDYTKDYISYYNGQHSLQWNITTEEGTIYGVCMRGTGNLLVENGVPESATSGLCYCWCKTTYFKPTGSNVMYETTPARWVYMGMESSFNDSYRCPAKVINNFHSSESNRKKLLN